MKLPETAHTSRSWRIQEFTRDFRLYHVWALPTPGGPDNLPRLGLTGHRHRLQVLTQEYKINYLRPADGEKLCAAAQGTSATVATSEEAR